jgi:uncharacterized membrane protein
MCEKDLILKREIMVLLILLSLLFLITELINILTPSNVLAKEKRTAFIMRLIPGDYNKKVTPGEENTLHLDINNIGDSPITNVKLSAEAPDDWGIDFDPATIDRLNAGSMQTVTISIVPAGNADRDKYQVTVFADANEIRRVTRVNVRIDTATSIWTWIGAGISLVLMAVFVLIFKRYGR